MRFNFPKEEEILELATKVQTELTKGVKQFWGTLYFHKENLTRAQVEVKNEEQRISLRPAIGVAWQWGAILYFKCDRVKWLCGTMTEQIEEDLERMKCLRELAVERGLNFVHLAKNEFAYYSSSQEMKPLLGCLKPAMVLFDLKSSLKVDLHFVYEVTRHYLGGKVDLQKMARLHQVFFRGHYMHNGYTAQGIFETKQLPEQETWLSKEIEKIAQNSWVLIAFDYGIVEDAALDWISGEEEIE